jgi:hypothetical protein
VHTNSLQQPSGQEVASQTQALLEQCSPGLQEALEPHRQTPLDEQLSATLAPQVTHEEPLAPQLAVPACLQVASSSQQPEHDIASQTQSPSTHRWPAAQAL